MIIINGKKALEELKNRYKNNKVSLLVGAGFSKNAWKSFPMWDGLLSDMVKEMYGVLTDVKQAVNKRGYLGIVSDYISRKGMREAVESYIEQRIPYIGKDGRTLHFVGKAPITLSKDALNLHSKLLSLGWERIYTTNYDELLETAAELSGKKWKPIDSAANLSFNNVTNNLIVKLHGTIYNQDSIDHKFEFDGNHHHRYIISKEDYENYPKEHEAFTQLMRISLLQGTFCLIGFSGNDPNFVSWLEWMRDVLIRSQDGFRVDKAKVFLIDVSGENPTYDRQLFYVNHHIVYVSLRDSEMMDLLDVDKDIMNNDDWDVQNRHLMERFIAFLNDEDALMQKLGVSSSNGVYSALWYRTSKFDGKEFGIDVSVVNNIMKRMQNNRIVLQTDYQNNFLWRIRNKKTLSSDEISLIIIALRDTGLPLVYYLGLKENLYNASLNDWQKKELQHLENREMTLYGKELNVISTNSDLVYEAILQTAFQLNFTKLYFSLHAWTPCTQDKLKKAIWISLFDRKQSMELLEAYKNDVQNVQDEFWATEYLEMFTLDSKSNYSTVKYVNMGLQGIYKVRDAIIDKCIAKKDKIKPYGDAKTQVICMDNIKNTEYEYSVKALQLLMNLPLMPSIGNIMIISPEKWYNVFKGIYESHPYPALFYSLTITDKNVLRRIGQDFCYSDKLFNNSVLDDMGRRMIKGILDEKTPVHIRTHSYIVLRELLNVIKANIWERDFIQIWNKLFLPVFGDDVRYDEQYKFVCKAVSLFEEENNIKEIIKDILIQSKKNRNTAINILYYVHTHIKDKPLDLNDEIFQFIEHIDDIEDVQILGNINECLTEEHKQKLCEKVLTLNGGEIVIKNSINALCYLAEDNPVFMSAFKKAILNSKRLWDNGIFKDGASPGNPLKISQFDNKLKWLDGEVVQIYQKLIKSVNTLLHSKLYKDEDGLSRVFGHYDDLFLEMTKFIELHKDLLKQQDGFDELYATIQNELNKTRGFIDIEDGLLSDDENAEADAMRELIHEMRKCHKKEYDNYVEMIADRILYNKKEGFDVCLDFLSYIVKTFYKGDDLSKSLVHKIQLILKRNDRTTLAYMEVDLFRTIKYLILLAKTMEKFQMASEDTKKWIDLEQSQRFNFKLDA